MEEPEWMYLLTIVHSDEDHLSDSLFCFEKYNLAAGIDHIRLSSYFCIAKDLL